MSQANDVYRVLLPVDSDEKRAISAAKAVASLPGGPEDLSVVVLNVFEEFELTDEGGKVTSEDLMEQRTTPDSVGAAVDVLEDAGIHVEPRLAHGDVADEIVSIAAEMDADCIAIGGRKRSPAGKALFGSVTQSVMLSAKRPVLSVISD